MNKKEELKINKTIAYINKELCDINHNIEKNKLKFDCCDDLISESNKLLSDANIDYEKIEISKEKEKLKIKSFEEFLTEANSVIPNDILFEQLFSREELIRESKFVNEIKKEFDDIHKLDKIDITISVIGCIVSSIVDILLVGIPQKTKDGLRGGKLENFIRDYIDKVLPPEKISELEILAKVPFDAQDNRHTNEYIDGLSAYYHRLIELGHDPILGFVVGIQDILKGKMTTIDKKGKICIQAIDVYDNRQGKDIFEAFAKECLHLFSDINTSMGLPVPLMGLFNLLQFGNIGEYHQTIAEIVQGMYYEGYDFIHFCSQSITVMILEVFIRICYAIKRVKEGKLLKNTIPFSLKREKNPKLATMLFIGHTGCAGINAGRVYFAKDPMYINYAMWINFAKYSLFQAKWLILDKPKERENYINNIMNNELYNIYNKINNMYSEMQEKYIII